jgi:hypothetical protein
MANGQTDVAVDRDDTWSDTEVGWKVLAHTDFADSARNEGCAAAILARIAGAEIARILAWFSTRRDGRVVDGGGLENIFCPVAPGSDLHFAAIILAF